MRPRTTVVGFAILIPVVIAIVAATTLLGPRWITWDELTSPGQPAYVFWHLRVPRSLLAAVAGAGLAVGGVIFQALFRNPLAEPYTLGVAGGASLGAALGFLTGWRGWAPAGVPALTVLAFVGALVVMSLVYLVSRLRRPATWPGYCWPACASRTCARPVFCWCSSWPTARSRTRS